MAGEHDDAAGETRLRGEDETGPASGVRDLAVLAIAAALFGLAALIVSDAVNYPIRRSYAKFGPEIFPYLIAGGIAVLAVITVVLGLRGGFETRARLNIVGVLWITGAILAEIAMLYGGAGFILSSAVLFGASARAFGQTTLPLNFAIGFVMSGLLYLLFRYGLGLALPGGPLERGLDTLLR